ncbi:unnamed protein product [Leptosia nina]|uniref:Secreted protein n=1 Tax=Leptosia nina TaxID=320188 RepID=A0AAV1JQA4_9NEOP
MTTAEGHSLLTQWQLRSFILFIFYARFDSPTLSRRNVLERCRESTHFEHLDNHRFHPRQAAARPQRNFHIQPVISRFSRCFSKNKNAVDCGCSISSARRNQS